MCNFERNRKSASSYSDETQKELIVSIIYPKKKYAPVAWWQNKKIK